MNDKVLRYISDLMGKVFADSIEAIVKFVLNIERVDRNKLMPLLENAREGLKEEEDNNTINIAKRIGDLRSLESLLAYLNDLNEGVN